MASMLDVIECGFGDKGVNHSFNTWPEEYESMTGFIEWDVRDLRDSTSSETVTLLVGYEEDRESLVDNIEEAGGQVDEIIGRTTILVTIEKRNVDALCEIESILAIEKDKDDVRLQKGGNSKRLSDLTM